MRAERPLILVVSESEDQRELISQHILNAGHDVINAAAGNEAMACLKTMEVDLVVLDSVLPDLSGIDVVKWLRRSRKALETPVVMVAASHTDNVLAALDAGANDCVTLPLDLVVTLARIKTLLRMKADSKEHQASSSTTAAVQVADAARHVSDVKPGMVLGGKYRLGKELGAGNFGTVFRATHLAFDQPVAVKVLRASLDNSSNALERFQQEGRSAFRLRHPNAVSVTDFGVTSAGLAYLVMELLEGCTLEKELEPHSLMSQSPMPQSPMSQHRAAAIVLSICNALEEAHELGILHRDIKPANIFLQRSGKQETVKVLDFGTAKLVGDAAMNHNLTIDGNIIGTPAYMAPERLLGKSYDGRTDAYSVGVMLYQMLAGRLPFVTRKMEPIAIAMLHVTTPPEPPSCHRPDIAPDLEKMVMKLLTKDPDGRPGITDLAYCLRLFLKVHPVPVPNTKTPNTKTANTKTANTKTPNIRPASNKSSRSSLTRPPSAMAF